MPAQPRLLARRRLVGRRPGAHSHVGGVRWWNRLRPQAWRDALAAGVSPAAGASSSATRRGGWRRVMLGVRTADGVALRDGELASADELAGAGCSTPTRWPRAARC